MKRANYQGDVGPHVAKAIWGIEKLGLDASDSSALGKAYAAGSEAYESDATAKQEIDALNAKVYDRADAHVNEVYAAGRKASLAHFEELYKILGTKFDHYFFESETAPRGVALVQAHPKVFIQSDGAIVYRGEDDGLHTRVFLTSKGLPTYETKELGLAELKAETWDFDTSITITAHEQSDYFEVVLAAMKKVLPALAAKITHISHGMMRFADGKMSSRTGNVITGNPYSSTSPMPRGSGRKRAVPTMSTLWRKPWPSRLSNIRYSNKHRARILFLTANARSRSKAIRGRICNTRMRGRNR